MAIKNNKIIHLLCCLAVIVILITIFTQSITTNPLNIFESFEGKRNFVLFHVDWCGHCKITLPIFNELKRKYKGDTKLIDYDITNKKEESTKYNISSFPTLRYYYGDYTNSKTKYDEFNGERTINSMLQFLSLKDKQ